MVGNRHRCNVRLALLTQPHRLRNPLYFAQFTHTHTHTPNVSVIHKCQCVVLEELTVMTNSNACVSESLNKTECGEVLCLHTDGSGVGAEAVDAEQKGLPWSRSTELWPIAHLPTASMQAHMLATCCSHVATEDACAGMVDCGHQ